MSSRPPWAVLPLLLLAVFCLATPAEAFGAGYVARGSGRKGVNFRHGDIISAIYFMATANTLLVRKIYFGNWLRDFSQILDKKSLEIVPEPILRALVSVLAYVQFGYTTGDFEVTTQRLGMYRPEEHIDNPKGYAGNPHPGLRAPVHLSELNIDWQTGMKSYIANQKLAMEMNQERAGTNLPNPTASLANQPPAHLNHMPAQSDQVPPEINQTSYDYIEKQLVAAIACARSRDPEAYIHLGAAMHTLEDFVAHSNWVELCMRMISSGTIVSAKSSWVGSDIFPFVGEAASVQTNRGPAPPLVTGTFGALDLYQSLLGEIDDKVASMSITSIQKRMPEHEGPISAAAKALVGLLNGAGTNPFSSEITSLAKATTNKPANWGELNETPELLWKSIEPVFRLRDKIVRWVFEHLYVKAIQDAVATISTAVDKLVYSILGIFLAPILKDLSLALKKQEEELLIRDQQARAATGEGSIFDRGSRATDPTHSQLCKDHYDSDLNELAGRVATRISTYTVTRVAELWQPGNTEDPRPALASILEALHHPYNFSADSPVQSMMVAEVLDWCHDQSTTDSAGFAQTVRRLGKPYLADKLGEYNQQHSHSTPGTGGSTAHDLVTLQPKEVKAPFAVRIGDNIAKAIEDGAIPGLTADVIPGLRKLLMSPSSADAPNPIDSGLSGVGGSIGLIAAFKDIEVDEIVSSDGMGNVLKEAIVGMLLRDEGRLTAEEEVALGRFDYALHGDTGKEAIKVKKRAAREMQKLLEFEKLERIGGEVPDGGAGVGGVKGKLMRGIERMKISSK